MRVISSGMVGRKLFVSFKISERCNLACKYCYFFFKGDESYLDHPAYIAEQTVRSVGRFLGEGARDMGIETVSIAMHGGEPLMVGPERFEKYCEILRETILPYTNLKIGVQTNGLLLNQKWIDLLAQINVNIGISIDGPKALNDAVRIDDRGRGSYDKIVKAINLLHDNVARGTMEGFGALSVLNPDSSAKAVYQHLIHDLGLKKIDFMLPKYNWDDYDPAVIKKVEDYSLELLNCWLADDNPNITIRNFNQVMNPFLTDKGIECKANHIIDINEAITIRSNGDVSPDDTTPALSEECQHSGFNVETSTLKAFYEAPLWESIRTCVEKPPEKCTKCEWVGFCGGGLIETRYSKANQFNNPTIYCQRNKMLYARMAEHISQFVSYETIMANRELSNRAILCRAV
jgi:uncharacterized protein